MELPSRAFKAVDGGTLLVCPGSARRIATRIAGGYGEDSVKITLPSPPVDGRANQALCRLIADWCGLPKARVEIASGHVAAARCSELPASRPKSSGRY